MNLRSLPLFPLGAVLYPDGLLSLQVFEVRYLDMIGRCHKTGAPFGVVRLTEGAEVRQPSQNHRNRDGDSFAPQVFNTIGTLARIIEFATPQAGLLVIQCTGIQRFAIERREKLKHGLWVADVTLMAADQTVPIPPDLQGIAIALRNLLSSLQARHAAVSGNGNGDGGAMPVSPPYQFDDCAWVSNRWCELLPIPPDLKQRMLELDNPLVRLELVGDILERTGIAT